MDIEDTNTVNQNIKGAYKDNNESISTQDEPLTSEQIATQMQQAGNLFGEIQMAKQEDKEDEDWEYQMEQNGMGMEQDDDYCFGDDEEFGGDEEIQQLSNNLPINIEEYLKQRNNIEPSMF